MPIKKIIIGVVNPDLIQSNFERAYQQLVDSINLLGYNVTKDKNFDGTADRCTRAFLEVVAPKEDIEKEVKKHLSATFPAKYDEMIVQTDIEVISLCPHHLIPVEMNVHLAYIPRHKVLGLSKLVRIARVIGRQPILQEDYTQQLAEAMQRLNPLGVAVFVKGKHGCMRFRGVKTKNGHTITSCMVGAFKKHQATREEFLELCRHV